MANISNITIETVKTVKPNIYNDKGCANTTNCENYGAWTNCLVDLYPGMNVCQYLYILDEKGQPIDLERLDKIEIVLTNEFGCAEMTTEYGLSLQSMQIKYEGPMFDITPDNFWDMDYKYFDLHNVRVTENNLEICHDETKAIILGNTDDEGIVHEGHIIFNPLQYSGDLFLDIETDETNKGQCIAMVNGLPQPLSLNKKNFLVNILNGCDKTIISLLSVNPSFEQTEAILKRISFSCTKGYVNKGLIKVCYSGNLIPSISGRLTAEILLKFNMYDDEYPDGIKIIKCFPMANVRQSLTLSGIEPPIKKGTDNEIFTIVLVDKLPVPGWNTMNRIYLIRSEHRSAENEAIEYVTVKTKVNDSYSYHWERIGDNYDIVASSVGDTAAAITLTNDDDTDTIIIKHKERQDDKGSMIEFSAEDNTITAKITNIDGGLL